MTLKLSENPTSDFVEYNKQIKFWFGIALFCIIGIGILFMGLYFGILKDSGIFQGTFVDVIWNHVKGEIFNFTSIGIFYVAFIGGLFFLFTPIDPVYIGGLLKGNFSPVYAFAMFSGLFLSYCINYIIGYRFSKASRNLISAKEFYKTKVLLNRYGNLAILFMNLLGFGAQQLIFVLGVFRYNKARVILFSVIGILIRYTILTSVVLNIN